MNPGDIVTEATRVRDERDGSQEQTRKVYLVLGPSRAPGKVRIATWSHAAKAWSQPHARPADLYVPAPRDWPQTKAVERWIAERGVSAAIHVATYGGR